MALQQVNGAIRRLKQWRGLYDDEYIRHHFVIWNDDGEATALVDEIVRLQNLLKVRKSLKGG